MLSHKYRFHSRGGVRYVHQKGKTIRTPLMALIFTPNLRHYQRFGVVISKKVLKSAVGRNRIRRRVYEALRLELDDFTYPIDCLFVIHSRSVAKLPFLELRRLIHELLERALVELASASKSKS